MSTDLSGIGLRLREVRKDKEKTQPVMAAVIDVSDRTYKYYEQERRELPALAALKICEAFDVNLEWLLAGRGQMRRSDAPEFAEACSWAVLTEHQTRELNLPIDKLTKIIGFVAQQASQSNEAPIELAKKYFETL